MKVFISYRFGDDISAILKILENNKIELFDSSSLLFNNKSIQSATKDTIKACDFVILLYSKENSNIAFEAGMAFTLNKPIFSIVSPDIKEEPAFIRNSACVRSFSNEYDKISFNFNVFLKSVRPKKITASAASIGIHSHVFYGGGEAVSQKYQEAISIWDKFHQNENGHELFFQKLFELYQIKFVQNTTHNEDKLYADFSIWSDQLTSLLGNPILVEISKTLSSAKISTFLNEISKNNNHSYLFFYETLRDDNTELPSTSRCLFISIYDLLQKLKSLDFSDSIRQLRNEIAHKTN